MPGGIGPLTRAELMAIWQSAVDEGYSAPLLAAGDGNGLEVFSQAGAQFERASQAIDRSIQALYLLPWSGQTNPPASGGAKATVMLTFMRTQLLERPLVLGAGSVFYEEYAPDWGEDGTEMVATGRRYTLVNDLVIFPGQTGPVDALAVAENIGYGYNNPQPGNIQLIDQPGSAYANQNASVAYTPGAALPALPPPNYQLTIRCANVPDMLSPDSVGQYVQFMGGSNTGACYRAMSFIPPDPVNNLGSGATLELLHVVEGTSFSGTYTPGEIISITPSFPAGPTTAYGRFVASMYDPVTLIQRVAFVILSGDYVTTNGPVILGAESGATSSFRRIDWKPAPVSEAPVGGVGGAAWRILDWVEDWGLAVTNHAQPSGGLHATLDQSGADRNVFRAPGEVDDDYRQRVARVADTISPNAIVRKLNKVFGPTRHFCFREVGYPGLPGVYFDRVDNGDFFDLDAFDIQGLTGSIVGTFKSGEPVEYRDAAGNKLAYGWFGGLTVPVPFTFNFIFIPRDTIQGMLPDTPQGGDVLVGMKSGAKATPLTFINTPGARPQPFALNLDYTEFRAFFLVGVPALPDGDFGTAFDEHPRGFMDIDSAFDGFSTSAQRFYGTVKNALNDTKTGGVTFDFYLRRDGEPCP